VFYESVEFIDLANQPNQFIQPQNMLNALCLLNPKSEIRDPKCGEGFRCPSFALRASDFAKASTGQDGGQAGVS
jgi:hypothetical protein